MSRIALRSRVLHRVPIRARNRNSAVRTGTGARLGGRQRRNSALEMEWARDVRPVRDVLVIVDVLNDFSHEDGADLLDSFRERTALS